MDNEFETIRLGASDYANFNGNPVVEYNHFYRCDGEIEIISNKSSNNTYRYNTIVESQGSIVRRHVDGCLVEGNVIIGNGVTNTGGIRHNGQDHVVRNNYVAGTRGSGLRSALTLRRAEGVLTGDTNGGMSKCGSRRSRTTRFMTIRRRSIRPSRLVRPIRRCPPPP